MPEKEPRRIGDQDYYGSLRRPDGGHPGESLGSPLPRPSPRPPSGPQNDSSDPAFGIFVALLLSLPLWLEIGCLLGLIR